MPKIPTVLTMVVSAGALWLAFELADGVSEIELEHYPSVGWLSAAILLYFAIVFLLASRWHRLTRCLKDQSGSLPYRRFIQTTWAGLGLSQIVLGPISGDALRVASLRECNIPISNAVQIVLLDRIIGLIGLLLTGLLALSFLLSGGQLVALWIFVATVALLGIVCVSMLSRYSEFLRQLSEKSYRTMLSYEGWVFVAMAFLSHLMNIGIYVCLAYSVGLHPPLLETVVSVAGGLLSGLIPVSFGGWGVRELVIFQLFEYQGIVFAQAITISILFGLIHVAMGIPGLLLFGWRKTMQLGHDSEIRRNV